MNPKLPGNDHEADGLRAYIPTETLVALAKLRDEEMAEHDKKRRAFDDAAAEIAAIKERMRRDRIRLKKLDAQKREYFSAALFARTDAAREAAWIAAFDARSAAIDRGEPLRRETVAECGARQKNAGACYTP